MLRKGKGLGGVILFKIKFYYYRLRCRLYRYLIGFTPYNFVIQCQYIFLIPFRFCILNNLRILPPLVSLFPTTLLCVAVAVAGYCSYLFY